MVFKKILFKFNQNFIAKDLLLKLLTKDPIQRISATQALNHEFLKENSQFETNENDIDVPIPSKNLKIFNTRNFNLEKINPQNYSPVSSPLASLVKNKIEIGRKLSEHENINNFVSFIMITPALNGNINTFKSFNESNNKDKNVSEESFSPLLEKSIFFKKMIESSNSQYSHKTN